MDTEALILIVYFDFSPFLWALNDIETFYVNLFAWFL
jgi:hypothetical protein